MRASLGELTHIEDTRINSRAYSCRSGADVKGKLPLTKPATMTVLLASTQVANQETHEREHSRFVASPHPRKESSPTMPLELIPVSIGTNSTPSSDQASLTNDNHTATVFFNKEYKHLIPHMTKEETYPDYSPRRSDVPTSHRTIDRMIRNGGPFYPCGVNHSAKVTFDAQGVSIEVVEGRMPLSFKSGQYNLVASVCDLPEISERTKTETDQNDDQPLSEDLTVLLRDREMTAEDPWLRVHVAKGTEGVVNWRYGELQMPDGTDEDGNVIPKSTGRTYPTIDQIRG